MTTAGYTRAQVQEAERLIAVSDKWAAGRDNQTGQMFNVFASKSAPGTVHKTWFDGSACSCPRAQKSRSGRCCHRLACTIVTERAQESAARRPIYEDLFVGDGSQLTDAF